MCGIIGYIGTNNAADILLNGLELLEYRGYDSAGVAFHNGQNIDVYKCAGRVSELKELVPSKSSFNCGIGHTRWATHGSVSYKNAHPHQVGKVTLVHNGIIENYKELTHEYDLSDTLKSSGDSEVVAALLNYYYKGDPINAIKTVTSLIRGTYALVILFNDRKDEIYAIRKISPIVVTQNNHGSILASDLMALSDTKEYFVLPENSILKMTKDNIEVFSLDGNLIKPTYEKLNWQIEHLNKKDYPFYMEKEISEEPEVIEKTLNEYLKDSLPDFHDEEITSLLKEVNEIAIVACGTSYHASLVAKYLFEKYAKVRTNVYLSSEFIYNYPIMDPNTLVIGVSQSGETIDTLEAINQAKANHHKTLSIINVKGSSIAVASDKALYTQAGPEIAVASTKAYTCQIMLFNLLVYACAYQKGLLSLEQLTAKINQLHEVSIACSKVIEQKKQYQDLATKLASSTNLFMIGRGLDYYILLEAALKLKEISYIHCEAYASGELKHGPIALIEKDTPVIASITQKDLASKESSNIKEVRARGANAFVFIKESLKDDFNQNIPLYLLPDLDEDLMVFTCVISLQLFAYYTALAKGINVDKPRNLAKVVTVE